MRAAKLDETTINSILIHWSDIMASRYEEIRRTIDKMDTAKN
jgi:hypothetical protein